MAHLIVPATLDSLGSIRQFVNQVSQAAGLDERGSYNLSLAVDEIASNIILYGYQDRNSAGNIKIYSEQNDEMLTIILEDSGVPFDPCSRVLPTEEELNSSLEERAMGGLGIYLALQGTDHFHYERVEGLNRNIFQMKRT